MSANRKKKEYKGVIRFVKESAIFMGSFIVGAIITIIVGQASYPIQPFSILEAAKEFIWSQYGICYYLVISLLIWFATTILIRVKSHSKCPYFESKPDSTTITLSLEGILRDIGGLYQDLEDTHSPLQYDTLRDKLKILRQDLTHTALPALVFTYNHCGVGDYARIAKSLDTVAKKSIKSTNVSLPSVLLKGEYQASVLGHLGIVNKRIDLKDRYRIQVLKGSEVKGPDAIKDESAFKSDLINNGKISNLWNEQFIAKASGVKYSEALWDKDVTADTFYGDYILYDDEIILMYDYESAIMMVLIGKKIGKAFSAVFDG